MFFRPTIENSGVKFSPKFSYKEIHLLFVFVRKILENFQKIWGVQKILRFSEKSSYPLAPIKNMEDPLARK